MPPSHPNPWQRRLRRLFVFVGAASTFYFLASYTLDRMRAARVKALKEKRERDTMKSHFNSLLSTITFTLYALLPTIQPQLFEAYPVEAISQELQSLSMPSSSDGSIRPTPDSTPANSLLLEGHSAEGSRPRVESVSEGSPRDSISGAVSGVGESWASEFGQREGDSSAAGGMSETDDGMTMSTTSQSISLPGTDTSSMSPSPPSDLSQSAQLLPSPPQPDHDSDSHLQVPAASGLAGKSKKELWKELKIQSITRAITTAYLLPLLYLLTTSQLSILARKRYLEDVKSGLPLEHGSNLPSETAPAGDEGSRTPRGTEFSNLGLGSTSRDSSVEPHRTTASVPKSGWFHYFSIESMGLGEYVESSLSTSIIPNPLNLVPTSIKSYLPNPFRSPIKPTSVPVPEHHSVQIAEVSNAEAERLFLTYSWWLLHEGWRGIASRVEMEVQRVLGGVGLKREIELDEWEALIKEVRAGVETEIGEDGRIELYDFVSFIIPPSPLPSTSSNLPVPLPESPTAHSKHLVSLLRQTEQHLQSPDSRYLLDKGVTILVDKLINSLREACYTRKAMVNGDGESDLGVASRMRLVDCLPEITSWSRGVWENIPDRGVESLLTIPEFGSFAALIFGDWAPQFD